MDNRLEWRRRRRLARGRVGWMEPAREGGGWLVREEERRGGEERGDRLAGKCVWPEQSPFSGRVWSESDLGHGAFFQRRPAGCRDRSGWWACFWLGALVGRASCCGCSGAGRVSKGLASWPRESARLCSRLWGERRACDKPPPAPISDCWVWGGQPASRRCGSSALASAYVRRAPALATRKQLTRPLYLYLDARQMCTLRRPAGI